MKHDKTVMNDDNPAERAAALVQRYLDLLRLGEDAPTSPVSSFVPAKWRRVLRRDAARLRQRKAEPRFKNLYSAEELADLYERTAERDEMYERSVKELKRIGRELERLHEEHPAEVRKAMVALLQEAQRSAEEQGPGSEAARRLENMLRLAGFGRQWLSGRRRQKPPAPRHSDMAPDRSFETQVRLTAAEPLTAPPSPGETVIAIPPEGQGPGCGRVFFRIGTGRASWIGSFERGHTGVNLLSLLPDGKHLFVSAEGAGYVVDAQSRTLVERSGTRVIGTWGDEASTLFIVNHDGMCLEAFGRSGRLWKTGIIGAGAFRNVALAGDELRGEACYPIGMGWARFSVKIATGEVKIEAADVRTE